MRLVRARSGVATWRIALLCASVAVLAAGCHIPGTGGGGSVAPGSGSITVALVPGIDNAPLEFGIQQGLFRQHGLNVTIQRETSVSQVIDALNSGQAQIAEGDYTDFFWAQYTGRANLRLIADGYDAAANSMAILTLPNSPITTPQDLVNRTVASPAQPYITYPQKGLGLPYNMPTLAAEQVLQSDGLSPSDVSWSPMPEQQMIAALGSGQVKAILASEPYIYEAEAELGAVEVVDASTGVTGSNLPVAGYFSLASYAKSQSSTLQAFQAALSQAQSSASMGGGVQDVLPQYADMTKQDASMVTLGTYPTALSAGQVGRVLSLMEDAGMISSPDFSVSNLVLPQP